MKLATIHESEYEDLEDVDEFDEGDPDIDECDNCHAEVRLDHDNWDQCECDALWCGSCLDHNDFTWALKQDDYTGKMYEVMAVCPRCRGQIPPDQGLQESDEYEGLEDVDEFDDENDEVSVCEGCGELFPLDAITQYCEGCHGAWCDRCYDENADNMEFVPEFDENGNINDKDAGIMLSCPACKSGAVLWR